MKKLPSLLLCLLLLGCSTSPTFRWGYIPDNQKTEQSITQESVAIVPFEEARPPRKYETEGSMFLLYLPLIPYVSMEFERLEESVKIQSAAIEKTVNKVGRNFSVSGAKQYVAPSFEKYYYPETFPRAIATDLERSGIFKSVKFVSQEVEQKYRYVLTGKIKQTPLTRSTSSYGLGAAGVMLWLIPLPMTKTSAEIVVDLTLTDTSNKKVVWQHELRSHISKISNMYSASGGMLYGRSVHSFKLVTPPSGSKVDNHSLFSWHFEALRLAMNEAKPLLTKALVDYTSNEQISINNEVQ